MAPRLSSSRGSVIPGRSSLPPLIASGVGGQLVVSTTPLSVTVSIRVDASSPILASVEVSLPMWQRIIEDCDVAILASRLGLLASPAGPQ